MTPKRADVAAAALAELGYPARVGPNGKVRVPSGNAPPCDVAWRASTLARIATGHPVETFDEWHARQNPTWRLACRCEDQP